LICLRVRPGVPAFIYAVMLGGVNVTIPPSASMNIPGTANLKNRSLVKRHPHNIARRRLGGLRAERDRFPFS